MYNVDFFSLVLGLAIGSGMVVWSRWCDEVLNND